jgi:hypothetical protein
MKIVIDIPEEEYQNYLKMRPSYPEGVFCYIKAIQNGTPLPEHHGDLIDRDSLELDCDWSDYYDGFSAYSESQVRLAPTVIEADKE